MKSADGSFHWAALDPVRLFLEVAAELWYNKTRIGITLVRDSKQMRNFKADARFGTDMQFRRIVKQESTRRFRGERFKRCL